MLTKYHFCAGRLMHKDFHHSSDDNSGKIYSNGNELNKLCTS